MPTTEYVTFTPEQTRQWQELFQMRRKTLGWSQMKAAEMAGVSQTLISSIERGPHIGLRAADLFKVAKVYGIEPNDIARVLGTLPEDRVYDSDTRKKLSQVWDSVALLPEDKLEQLLEVMEIVVRGITR